MAVDSERPRLREYRSQVGWTQQELADRLAHLAWMEHREQVAVNADMVAKWERGVKGVSPRYRELFCRLFGVTPDQLGFKNAPVSVVTSAVVPGWDESLAGMLDDAAHLLDQLGAAGSALAPHMLEAWKDAITTRRTVFGLFDPAGTDPAGHARVVTATVAEVEQLADRYQVLYETADPAVLMTSVVAHLRMTSRALSRGPAGDERRRLLRNQARVAILAGRLAAEDLGNPLSGRAYYTLACDSARDAGDEQLVAVAHGCAAHLAAAEGMSSAALDHLTVATECARGAPLVVSWLAALEATLHAERGEQAAARKALDRAQAAGSTSRTDQASWRGMTTVNVTAVRGRVLLRAGDHNGARAALTAALQHLDPGDRRERVLVLIDLATAELLSGDPAAACSHATQAATLLQQARYALGASRLRVFRAVAQQPLDRRTLRVLDEHLSRIAA